tara:strand:+ start:283 stop:657 length:375 start_codon:yes stop_codon:yes gene_type:complete
MNIFQELDKRKVCYSVVKAKETLIEAEIDEFSYDCFILVDSRDVKMLKKLGFKKQTKTKHKIHQKTLDEQQTKEFDQIKDTLDLVVRNEFGKVYELKNNSFKKRHGINERNTEGKSIRSNRRPK